MIAAPFATVMGYIYNTVLRYYADAEDVGVPLDGDGGGWALSDVEPIDILDELDTEWSDELREDILHCLEWKDKYWVSHSQHNWSLANPTEVLAYGWREFTETVLHKTRYLFLTEPIDEINASRPDYIPVPDVLDTLGTVVTNLNLVTRLDCRTVCYRARVGQGYKEFSEVSVPPKDHAGAGRMNPAGIPYLYVALDGETARREIKPEKQEGYTLATLKTKASLLLLNLADLPTRPSIFELDKYNERHQLQFLDTFSQEIRQPVSKDGKEHIEYIPTQIISEFFRHRFTYHGEKLDGIMFNSSQTDGKNVTLFVSNHEEIGKIMDLTDLENCPAELTQPS